MTLVRIVPGLVLLVLFGPVGPNVQSQSAAGDGEKSAAAEAPARKTITLRGRVLPLGEALRRIGAATGDEDQANGQMVLLDARGQIHPLLKDARGRGFWKDARLRDVPMELRVRKLAASPYVQVIRVFMLRKGKRLEVDYWCDICAIQMFELKQCECCQGPIRLRLRPVEEGASR